MAVRTAALPVPKQEQEEEAEGSLLEQLFEIAETCIPDRGNFTYRQVAEEVRELLVRGDPYLLEALRQQYELAWLTQLIADRYRERGRRIRRGAAAIQRAVASGNLTDASIIFDQPFEVVTQDHVQRWLSDLTKEDLEKLAKRERDAMHTSSLKVALFEQLARKLKDGQKVGDVFSADQVLALHAKIFGEEGI